MWDAINADAGTTMWYGSEYQPAAQLKAMYGKHKDWGYFKM